MANTSFVRGLKSVGHLFGGDPRGKIRQYIINSDDSTATFVGDLVKLAGASVDGIPTVIQAAAGDTTIVGVVEGFDPVTGVTVGSENLNITHRPASIKMRVLVNTDPNVIYEVQSSATGATTTHTLVEADMGENCDIVVAAGNTSTGLSGMQLDATTHTTSAKQLRLVDWSKSPDNAVAALYSKVLVVINQHVYKSTTGV